MYSCYLWSVLSLNSEINVSLYKSKFCCSRWDRVLESLFCCINIAQQNSPGDKLLVLRTGGANRQSFFLALCLKNNSLLFKDEMRRDTHRLPQAVVLAGVMC